MLRRIKIPPKPRQPVVRQRGISAAIIAVVVIVVVAVAGVGYYLATQPGPSPSSTSTSTSSTTSAATVDVQAAVNSHLSTIETRNVPNIVAEYYDSSLLEWKGQTQGLGGNYSGTGNIKLLYSGALGTAQSINLVPTTAIQTSGNTATFDMNMSGNSGILGIYNGTISVSITYTSVNGAPIIQHEVWNFHTFNVQKSGGATTFPQWAAVGGPFEERSSPDPFKQFVWTYGGEAMMVFVVAYLVAIAAYLGVRRWR